MPEGVPQQVGMPGEGGAVQTEQASQVSPLEAAGSAFLSQMTLPDDVNLFSRAQGKTNEFSAEHDRLEAIIGAAREEGVTTEEIRAEGRRQATVNAQNAFQQKSELQRQLNAARISVFTEEGRADPRMQEIGRLDAIIDLARGRLGVASEVIEGKKS